MNSEKPAQHAWGGIMPTEVVILWRSLVREYVSDLKMEVEPILDEQGRSYLRVSVISQRFDDERPGGYTYCWAFHNFPSMGYSIKPDALFDLLIKARDSIVWVLTHGDDPPTQPIKED